MHKRIGAHAAVRRERHLTCWRILQLTIEVTVTQALKGKLALVTGASRGIGASIATRLARDGASVLVHFASSPERAEAVVKAIRDAGGEAEAVGANLSLAEGVTALTDSLNGAFGGKFDGRLDILVNNAGTVEYGPFLDSSETSYDTHFNLNVRAPVELAKNAAKRMIKTGWGRIINVGSAFGEAAPLPGVTLYIASKFAVRGFTRGLSRELGKYGVTVNAVQPGPIDTELAPQPGTEDHATMTRLTSVGRFGKPEEIAAAVAYLASPEAGYTTGESLTVDGGWIA
jgi:3-oxoacyl-[acyl-carrier protein] reductase